MPALRFAAGGRVFLYAHTRRTFVPMPGMSDRPQPPHVRAWRQILNEHWPVNPRAIPRRDLDAKKVRARLVFEGAGEVWLEGKAERWTESHVWFVPDPYDERFQTNGVWLKPEDVYRMYDQSMMAEK